MSRFARPAFALLAAAAAWAAWTPAPAAAQVAVPVEAEADDEILVEIRVDRLMLAEAIAARRLGDGLALPLGELARTLDLAIAVDAGKGTATGFVLREDRTFALDVKAGTAAIGGRALPFDPALVLQGPDDVYVDLRQLERWLPLTLRYDPYALSVQVLPHEPLPVQTRLEREQAGEELGPTAPERTFERVGTPFAWVGDPAIDPSLNFGIGRDAAGNPRPTLAYSAVGSMDLLRMGTTWYATGDQDRPLADLRVTAGRRDAEGFALGPLGARELGMGFVTDPGLAMVAGAWSGPGVVVSSFPLNTPLRFDRHSFRGPLPPGWDAQLFRNTFPLAYQPAPIEGQYRFDDVPLVVGLNEFRLVLNGPQGQRRVETFRFNVGASLAVAGEHRYRVVRGVEPGGPRTTVAYDAGLRPDLTSSLGLAELPGPAGPLRYATAGLRGYAAEWFWHATAAADQRGGAAAEAGAQAPLGPFGVTARQSVVRGLEAVGVRPGDLGRSALRLDATAPPEWGLAAYTVLQGAVDWRANGVPAPELTHQVSLGVAGLTFTNVLVRGGADAGAFTSGTLEVGSQWGPFNLRGLTTYDPVAVRAVSFANTGRLPLELAYTAGVSVPLQGGPPSYTLSLNRALAGVTVGVTGSYAGPGALTAGLVLASGLALPGGGRPPAVRGQGLAGSGAAEVRCFLDADRDGRFDPDEQPLAGVELDLGNEMVGRTDARGVAGFPGLAAFQPMDADFGHVALEDPLLAPARKGVRFVPRPGRITRIELPVVATGEVYGTAWVQEGPRRREFAGATVELVDAEGRVAATAVSGLDGYYGLTGLAPGRYRLRIAPGQLKTLAVALEREREVVIAPQGTVVDGQDLTVRGTEHHE